MVNDLLDIVFHTFLTALSELPGKHWALVSVVRVLSRA